LRAHPELTLQQIRSSAAKELYSESEVYLAGVGISPSDPISHYAYQLAESNSLNPVVSRSLLAKIASTSSSDAFNSQIKDIERKIAKERLLVPIVHVSGVVAESQIFEKEESLSWSWGIQPWTYRISSAK